MLIRPLTTIPRGSRAKQSETQRVSFEEIVIWSDLHGDMQLKCRFVVLRARNSDSCRTLLSTDWALGAPFNIASYSLLLHMMAQCTGYKAGEFVHVHGDLHIYNNHVEGLNEQASRIAYDSPKIMLNPEVTNIADFDYNDISLIGYKCHPSISFPIAV